MESGTKLGHYEIGTLLGKGGMGEVWRAKDTKLGREVAIKTLPEEFAKDADRLARFEREARLLASLNHPNIAAIHGFEEDNGTHFLVLELVEGDTLADQLKRGAIPVEESLKLALQIAEALEAAHEKGVIHRDLKPANVKVTPDGKVKVLDFGLAKAFEGDAPDASVSNSPTLSMAATQQGVILGTAAYMSPEQAGGEPTDKRADIWAFGVVLFEILTGRQLFTGKNVTHILADVVRVEPEWDGLPVNLHPRVRMLLERSLEKEAKDRISGISDARVDIQKVLSDPNGVLVQPVAEVVQAAPQSKLPWVAGMLLTLIIGGAAVWLLQPSPSAPISRFDYELPEGIDFANVGRQVVAISPDGQQFVYRATGGFFLRAMDGLEAQIIAGIGTPNLVDPVFSPDGQEIAYADNPGDVPRLMKIAVTGGAPIVLAERVGNAFGISWESNGSILYGQPDGIWQVSENGGTPVQLISTEGDEQAYGPQLLPGGEWVLFTLTSATGPTRWDEADIVIESLSSGERRVLRQGGSDARYVPTGHLVYALEDVLFALPFDVDSLEPSGGPVSILQSVRRSNLPAVNTGSAFYSFSDSGALVYVPGRAGTDSFGVALVDRQGNPEFLPAPEREYVFPRLSPDDTRIAVQVGLPADIWIYEIASNILNQLTFDGGERPLWSPDGSEVAFLRGGALWTVPSDFSGTPTLLPGTEVGGNLGPGAWSPDGAVLLFSSTEGIHAWERDNVAEDTSETAEVIVRGPDGAATRDPDFSPDGRWFVYSSNENGLRELYANPYPVQTGPRQRITTDGGFVPVWVRNGGN